ncbi:MAG: class I mannose-6-phosphate isomerase [Clostridiaceae bacterium]|jgi:mannose-6-phosphate isomerase|nr:class I mannose-6-phosphate isomerase [Clostridiaceae bacterium]
MLYPLKFKPLYRDYVWGGRNLARLGKTLPPEGVVAESWEVSCHKSGWSIISNGEFEGMSLKDLIRIHQRAIVGDALPQKDVDKFPLLVKFIDAQDNLSVQVHPDDDYAYAMENGESGKNEMWYIVSAKPGAKLIYDVAPGTTREKFAQALSRNDVESCLKSIEVFDGDVINIPAGIVHAIGKGIILAEVQQSSDTTYRVYDYGRVGRELHIEKALDVIDFNSSGRKEKYAGLKLDIGNNSTKRIVVASQYFCIEIYCIKETVHEIADGSKFLIYTLTCGSGIIGWDGGKLSISAGESILIPAYLGRYSLTGDFTALKAYVPDLRTDLIKPLEDAGRAMKSIQAEIAGLEGIL